MFPFTFFLKDLFQRHAIEGHLRVVPLPKLIRRNTPVRFVIDQNKAIGLFEQASLSPPVIKSGYGALPHFVVPG